MIKGQKSSTRLQFRNTGVYSKDAQIDAPNDSDNEYNSNKKYRLYWPIPDYFPSDYYSVTYIDGEDMARNVGSTYMSMILQVLMISHQVYIKTEIVF